MSGAQNICNIVLTVSQPVFGWWAKQRTVQFMEYFRNYFKGENIGYEI